MISHHDITHHDRAEFLYGVVHQRYPFRRAQGWPLMAVRMLGWGLSCATILWVFERRYAQSV